MIKKNHLFKRSIILIKAWCYYESRILGAHHGLISTYALETLVLYIFHVFNNSFAGPLEVGMVTFGILDFSFFIIAINLEYFSLHGQVLYRFLEFFSKFDWDNFCVSLWGPVPISSLPDVTGTEDLLEDSCSNSWMIELQFFPFLSNWQFLCDILKYYSGTSSKRWWKVATRQVLS